MTATVLYRLVNARHADAVMSGEGAQRFGGRWNPPGFPVVYASESRALAVLETFVHLALEARQLSFLLYEISLPEKVTLHNIEPAIRGRTSRSTEPTQSAGRKWLLKGNALVLAVGSVIVPPERNYVLNVKHPQFGAVKVSKPESFSFDDRLWK